MSIDTNLYMGVQVAASRAMMEIQIAFEEAGVTTADGVTPEQHAALNAFETAAIDLCRLFFPNKEVETRFEKYVGQHATGDFFKLKEQADA